jgi:hypothetical protein
VTEPADDRAPPTLGQVLDVAALDASNGPCARVRVGLEPGWSRGDTLLITVPERLTCARCDGGGCDGCQRSGALRAPSEPGGRTVRVELPELPSRGVALRLLHPFGDAADVEQLRIELHASACSDAGVRVSHTAGPRALAVTAPEQVRAPSPLVVAGGLAALAALAAALLGQC